MSTQYPVYKDKPIDQWKVTELKDELRRRKLKANGLKDELVRQLDEALRSEMTPDPEEELGKCVDPDNRSQNVDQNDSEKNLEQPPAESKSEIVEDAAMADDEEETGDTTVDVTVEDTSDEVVPVNSVADDQSVVTLVQSNNPEANYDEMTRDSKPPIEDVKLTLSESTNQVSEVGQDLVFQVNCESISSDSLSINKKNEIKDNLNADNVHLELEAVNPEVVQPASSDVPTIGVDLHPLDNDKVLVNNNGSLEDVDDVTCTTEVELYKKIHSGDGGSPEKLSLDRSSGDDSMEEDVLESKQTESKDNSGDVGEMNEDKKVEVVQVVEPVDALVGDFSHEKKDRVSGDGIAPVEKRKVEDQEAVAIKEPKRQRRWNSETVKASEPQTVNITSTPKDGFHPSFRRSLSRTDSSLSGEAPKERIVPPPLRAATTSLRINNFLRPFTLKAAQELLSQTGTFSDFWMDHIKTHCYVTYSSVEEAVATRNALYNIQWPPNGGRLLTAEYVDPQEVKLRLEAPQSSAPVSPSPTTSAAPPIQPQAQAAPPPRHPLKQEQPPRPPLLPPSPALSKPLLVQERLPPPPPLKKPEPPIVTLDDLFKKTTAIPKIYYLPLSEEHVAAKLVAQAKRAQERQ